MNPRPPVPQTGALTGLRHAPTGTAGTIGLSTPVVLITDFVRMLQPCRKASGGAYGRGDEELPRGYVRDYRGLVPIGVGEQTRNHVADRRSDTQRDVKHGNKSQRGHGGLSPNRMTHIAHLCRRLWCKHTGTNVPPLTINSGCPICQMRE